MSEPWFTADEVKEYGRGFAVNEHLRQAMVDRVVAIDAAARRRREENERNLHIFQGHPGPWGMDCRICHPKVSRWTRLRRRVARWWDQHAPRVHLGPCDHSHCDC